MTRVGLTYNLKFLQMGSISNTLIIMVFYEHNIHSWELLAGDNDDK